MFVYAVFSYRLNASGNVLALFQMSKSCRNWRNQMRETNSFCKTGNMAWLYDIIKFDMVRANRDISLGSSRTANKSFIAASANGCHLEVSNKSFNVARSFFLVEKFTFCPMLQDDDNPVAVFPEESPIHLFFFGLSDEWSIQQDTHLHFIHISKQ